MDQTRRDTYLQLGWNVALALALCLATFSTATAQEQGLRYTLSPVGGWQFESDNSALDTRFFYGGELGIGFGEYLEVSGMYVRRDNVATDFSDFDALAGLPEPDVDLQRYGGLIRVNLGTEGIIPYLSLGTGVMEFDPDGVETTESIYATGGAGLTFEFVEQTRVSVGGELLSYRYNPATTFVGPDAPTDVDQETVYSPALRASLELVLGGRRAGYPTPVDVAVQRQFGNGLGGIRLFVEPFFGRVEFNEGLGFPKDQNLVGVNAGVELGPFVGVRGFYWRGTPGEDLFDEFATDFEEVAWYGGELRLSLTSGEGLIPYGILGGGYFNVLSGYSDDLPEAATPPDDRYFATVGGGLRVPLTPSFYVTGDLRYLLMSGQDIEDVSDPDEVFGSPTYTLGVGFSIGGGGREAPEPEPVAVRPPYDERPKEERPEEERAERPARIQPPTRERQELQARIDSLERALAQQRRMLQRPPADTMAAPPQQQPRRSNLSDRTINLPIPEVGELYLRVGEQPPGTGVMQTEGERRADVTARVREEARPALTQEEIREIVREAIRAEMQPPVRPQPQPRPQPQARVQPQLTQEEIRQIVSEAVRQEMQQVRADTARQMTRAAVERIARRVVRETAPEDGVAADAERLAETQRLEQQISALQQQITSLRQQLREPVEEEVQPPPVEEPVAEEPVAEDQPFYQRLMGRPLTNVYPFLGFRGGEGPDQMLVGARGDYRTRREANFRVLPEAYLGFGAGDPSLGILGNVAYTILPREAQQVTGLPIEPYVGAGLGLISLDGLLDLELASHLMIGTDYRLQGGNSVFIELGTFNLFDSYRFGVGYRVRF